MASAAGPVHHVTRCQSLGRGGALFYRQHLHCRKCQLLALQRHFIYPTHARDHILDLSLEYKPDIYNPSSARDCYHGFSARIWPEAKRRPQEIAATSGAEMAQGWNGGPTICPTERALSHPFHFHPPPPCSIERLDPKLLAALIAPSPLAPTALHTRPSAGNDCPSLSASSPSAVPIDSARNSLRLCLHCFFSSRRIWSGRPSSTKAPPPHLRNRPSSPHNTPPDPFLTRLHSFPRLDT